MRSPTSQPIIWIVNARLCGYEGLQAIAIQNATIARIIPVQEANVSKNSLDIEGDWLSLGGIDLQINGGLGLAFPDLTLTDLPFLEKIGRYLWERGVDGFYPTIVTTSVEKIQRSLAVIASSSLGKDGRETARILGVHLEGPFLNTKKRGAHPPEYLLPLTLENVKEVLGEFASAVKIITLAPELDEVGTVIPYLRSRGITVSLGHSLATAARAKEAFDRGASMVTHAFNAMPGLHHREPGLLGEAIARSGVYCGLIADGRHVCPTMMEILLRAAEGDRGVFLVSDALAPIGLPDGVYPWDARTIEVKQGTARLPDGTLSGTTLPLLVGAENLAAWGLCGVETAIALATESPRKAMGLPGFSVGRSASLLRWHWHEEIHKLSWHRLGDFFENKLEDRAGSVVK
ncbi:MAG: N-acetylglucosamine-6-phosphate deacetylase [Cyanobacteria bacterium SBLK]|nr:N-acetylglucosamine-6-phosphate deacetylase [Cyanobacteria bacterium SBLK]